MTELDGSRILVTGGCGFVGAAVIPELQGRGATVRVLDNLQRGSRETADRHGAELVAGDIRDAGAVSTAMADMDVVVHLAAFGSVVESIEEPGENFDINAGGTLNVLRGAQQAGVRRFIFASTGGAIMGNTAPPVNETSVPKPISPYGASKLCGEAYCNAFAGSYGLNTVMLRFGNLYGPWSAHKKGAVTVFMKALLTGDPIVIYGDGGASRDLLHVRDLSRGLAGAITADVVPASVFHLASGQETSIADLAALLKEIAGRPDHPVEHRPGRAGEVDRNFADYRAAADALGFSPTVSLREGMQETWDWFVANRETALKTVATDS